MSIYWRKMKIRNKKRATITSVLNAVATDYGLSKLNSLFIQRNDLLQQNEASKLLQRAI